MNRNLHQSGQSLIEILVAVALAMVLLPALLTGLVASREGKAQQGQRQQAYAYLKEMEEAVRSVRENGWSNITTDNTYHPVVSGSSWSLAAGAENISGTDFTRQVVISSVTRDNSGSIAIGVTDLSTKKADYTVSWTLPNPGSITNTEYLQRYLGNAATTHTSEADFLRGVNNGTIVTNNSGGEVQFPSGGGGGAVEGNQFLLTATSAIGNMTSSTTRTSLRFTAQSSKTVNAVRFYIHTEAGTSPTYTAGLQADSGGNPSGTSLGSGNFTATSPGWVTVNLSPGVSITAGNVYHLVVQHNSGTVSTSRYIALRRSTPQNLLYPYSGVTDSSSNTLFFSGSWTAQNFQPLYELDFSDGTYEGNPYEASTVVSVYGANFYGERFSVPLNKTLTDISFYISKNSATNPAGVLNVVLQNADTNTTIEEGQLATGSQLTTSYAYKTYTFTTPRILSAGVNYRLYLKSPSSNSTYYYRFYRLNTTNAANYNSITYQGVNAVYSASTNSGASWTNSNQSDVGGLKYSVQGAAGYPTAGDFTSSSIDCGGSCAYNYLTWGATTPQGTAVKLQVAINKDNATWNYFGSDGTPSTYFAAPLAIPFDKTNGRYLKYKAYLTGDGSTTPVLNDVTVNYSP